MSNDLITKDQRAKIVEAGTIMNEAFPNSNLQFCFNLSKTHSNVNWNIKASGIENVEPKKGDR